MSTVADEPSIFVTSKSTSPSSSDYPDIDQTKLEFFNQVNNLKIILDSDIDACDIKWTLFVAAAQSYRYDSRLKPFPPSFAYKGRNDIDQLLKVIDDTPPFKVLLHNILEENFDELKRDVIDLMHWVLVSLRDPHLRSIRKADFDLVLSKVPTTRIDTKPSHIFKVRPMPKSQAEEKFQKQAEGRITNFAFHGSKLDNFHSIINYGLQQHLSKKAAFGEGIYLSSELHVSLPFSPVASSWGSSRCGSDISCVALCEYVENPLYLKRNIKFGDSETSDSTPPSSSTNLIQRKKKNTIPEKYLLITNNEIVRVRYLLIYGKDVERILSQNRGNPVFNWIRNHKTLCTMCLYGMFLLTISMTNNRNGQYIKQVIIRKTMDIIETFKKHYFN